MRIVLDLQACQSGGSRMRGIGRVGWELALAMLQHQGRDEFVAALNAALPDTAAAIQRDLAGLLPPERCVTWRVPGPTAAADPRNAWRSASGEVLREVFLESLAPDWVHVGNLFQGFADDSLESVPTRSDAVPVAVTHHDLIPLVYPDDYITSPQARVWYDHRLDSLKRAALVLTNSEFTRTEAIDMLGLRPDRVVCISCAVSGHFAPVHEDPHALQDKLERCGITRPFVMYTGGADPRKNVEGLIRAFAMLPETVRRVRQLVLVGKEPADCRDNLLAVARTAGLASDSLVFSGFVADDVLVSLYNACDLFVFPSFREGFGLPMLEAMACGAPAVASDASSLPEVVGWADALFDSHSDDAMAAAMHKALTDVAFRQQLVDRGVQRAKQFTWGRSAARALDAMRAVGAALAGERADARASIRCNGIDHALRQESTP